MTAPIMSPEAAAWIRDHAWTAPMRREDADAAPLCPCQYGPCGYCLHGRHDTCINQQSWSKRRVAGYVCGRDGITPLDFPEPYGHETDASATVPHHTSIAQVWLADRVCRWVCPCDCRNAGAPPAKDPPAEPQPEAPRSLPPAAGADSTQLQPAQLDLFPEMP
ncbi:DUF6248 family natural product biosynthesis protein [Actinomadura bangladeshensis]|uniref:Uncharacterized protein n=1 Tax=Actinomadura bangladeshensis TaxID=453573 RepID=A0A6L9QAY3_9ACTN|nr:DUF6248 family natural product biosynthesis protein [Actinomadura bangladeshensis]NEA22657.1 hypothetical protein [Actinomadura bangladeshensis]